MKYPRAIERQYAARLVRRLRVARALILERTRGAVVDSARADGLGDWLSSTIAAVRRAYEMVMPAAPESLLPTAQAVDGWATRGAVAEVSRLVHVDLEGDTRIAATRLQARMQHVAWARENIGLITTMEAETFDDLAAAVAEAVVEGRTDLEAVIRDRFGVAESRARLIARDQIGKLNGQITQSRQTALGVQAYEWSSSGDERVRPLHRKLDGTVRRWDDPHPTEGHPGSAIACRCTATPVLDLDPVPAPPARPSPRPSPLPATFGGPAPSAGLPASFRGAPVAVPSEYLPRARLADRRDSLWRRQGRRSLWRRR